MTSPIEALFAERAARAAVDEIEETAPIDETVTEDVTLPVENIPAPAPAAPRDYGRPLTKTERAVYAVAAHSEDIAGKAAHRVVDRLYQILPASVAQQVVEMLRAEPIVAPPPAAAPEPVGGDVQAMLRRLEDKLTKPVGDLGDPRNLDALWREIMRLGGKRGIAVISNDTKISWADKKPVLVKLVGGMGRIKLVAGVAAVVLLGLGLALGVAIGAATASSAGQQSAQQAPGTVAGVGNREWADWLWNFEAAAVAKCSSQAQASGRDVSCAMPTVTIRPR